MIHNKTIKTNAGTEAYYNHSGIIAGIAEKFLANDAYQSESKTRLNKHITNNSQNIMNSLLNLILTIISDKEHN